ncbi:MAG TPA: BBP7 family outer membrane beta-barrel protein [Bradyrhizobium sp.]|nr:BBP7 family outer membrane beta-barrel protein [Bradyrhizobium sp.]
MRKLFAALATVLSSAVLGGLASASAADVAVKAPVKAPPPPMWWVSGGGLVWAVKGAPLPPTLTTFAPGTPSATTGAGGALGIPGTIQLSPDRMGFGALGGGQLAIGHWLQSDQRLGFEAGGFFLGSGGAGFAQSSNGSLPLRIPFTNVPPGAGFPLGASSFVLADPGFASGGQTISASLRLWGVEGNALYRAYGAPGLTVSVLAGLRYLDLREHLSIVSAESLQATPTSYTGSDYFSTKNQFIGAQIGVKAEKQYGQFDGSAVAKVAVGDNYQTVSVSGTSLITGTGFGTPPGLTPGGIFSQATNIGQQSRNNFAVVPEVQLQAGYRMQSGVRVFVGYNFLYVSNVVRPGDQIDTTLNFTGNPAITPGSTLTGAARPAPMFNSSSLWAQGLTFGASYQF